MYLLLCTFAAILRRYSYAKCNRQDIKLVFYKEFTTLLVHFSN